MKYEEVLQLMKLICEETNVKKLVLKEGLVISENETAKVIYDNKENDLFIEFSSERERQRILKETTKKTIAEAWSKLIKK